jgi:hypothetical protein
MAIADRQLAAGHEAAHRTLADHLDAAWSCAWIWPGSQRWDGLCRHSGVEPSLKPLIAAAGAAGEGLMHGHKHPSDIAKFLGAKDAAAVSGPDMENTLRYASHVLAGQRRAAWTADTKRLGHDLRIGEWRRSPHPPPPEWRPTLAADKAPTIIAKGMKRMSSSNESISVTGAPKYRSDWDCLTTISAFLAEKLTPDDLSNAHDLLAELVAELTGENPSGARMAADAAGRQTRVRQASSYATRFPNASRLNR